MKEMEGKKQVGEGEGGRGYWLQRERRDWKGSMV